MAHARWNHNAGARRHGHDLVAELHLCARFTLEKVVGLGEALVEMEFRVDRNIGDVYGRRKIGGAVKSPVRRTARTLRSWHFAET